MVQYATARLDASFAALSDATRRGVLEQLGREDASITDLAERFHMTLTGMKKHVGVLEQAGLVTTEKVGRVRTCKLGRRRLEEETAWLESYRQLLSDSRLHNSVWVQIKLSFWTVLLQLLIGLGLALLLNVRSRLLETLRTVFLIPMVLPPIVVAIIWKVIYTPDISPMHGLFRALGWNVPALITDPDWALTSIIIADTWEWFPFTMLMVLAALQMMPQELLDAARTNIGLAGNEGHPKRLRRPPTLEQLGLGPGLKHDARGAVEGSRNDELTLRLPFHRRAVRLTRSSCVHRASPSVSVPRQHCPARRSVRPKAGGTSRSMPPLLPVGADRACRSARARPSPW